MTYLTTQKKKEAETLRLFTKKEVAGVDCFSIQKKGAIQFNNTDEFKCIIDVLEHRNFINYENNFLDFFSSILAYGVGIERSFEISCDAVRAVQEKQKKEESEHCSFLPAGNFSDFQLASDPKISVSFDTETLNKTYYITGFLTIGADPIVRA